MWFTASLLYELTVEDVKPGEDALWEEKIVLIEASNEASAIKKLDSIARSLQNAYVNVELNVVNVLFVRIGNLCEIHELHLANGTELFSRLLDRSEKECLFKEP
jgi:hypothetical protein